MMEVNYFSFLCFAWAVVGIISRILMTYFGDRWNQWEVEKAYSSQKPKWIFVIGILSLIIVGFTWYKVAASDIRFSWIIAAFISLTLIKVFTLIFDYRKFREFAKEILNDSRKLTRLNIGVIIFSIALILMGTYLY